MSFDIRRLRGADRIVGASAIAFFIFLFFFKWYGVSSNVGAITGINIGGNISTSGWDTFTSSRWIWLITIIVALGSVVLVAAQRKLEIPIGLGVIVAGLGALSTLLVLYRIIHHPTASANLGSFHASVGIKTGIWLGLIAALGITYGGYLQMQEEGTSLTDVGGRASGAFSGLIAPGVRSSPGNGTTAPTPSTSSPSEPPRPLSSGSPAQPSAAPPSTPPISPPAPARVPGSTGEPPPPEQDS